VSLFRRQGEEGLLTPRRRKRRRREGYGVTVKFVTPGPPGAFDHGPQPMSDVGEQPVRDMHARVIPL